MSVLSTTRSIRAGLRDRVKAIAVAAALAGGCGFQPSQVLDDDGDPDAALDAAGALDAPAAPMCDPADDQLRACFTFIAGTVVNGAGTTLAIDAAGTTTITGKVGEGLGLGPGSTVHIGETPALDMLGSMTFEAFVRLDAVPSNRAAVYDDNGEWGVFVDDQRRPYCAFGTVVTGSPIEVGAWTHLACIYDRDRALVQLYVDGVSAGQMARGSDLPTSGLDGSNIGQDCRTNGQSGDPLTGGIDELRIWSVARSDAQIGAAAAR